MGFAPWPQLRWEKFLESGDMQKALFVTVDIEDGTYQKKYPVLSRLAEKASVNQVLNNLSVSCDEFLSFPDGRFVQQITSGNVETKDGHIFIDYEGENFGFSDFDSIRKKLIPGFSNIHFAKMQIAKSIQNK